ncbi:MAG: 4Fe-4S ferredoxin [Sporomusaceae bacterium]|nr:4Fe-4S ferredoxin [Sporomusaceae bacterium]
MSTNWYPEIDDVNCAECGICIAKCSQGVYDVEKTPIPIVINGDGCVTGCHGCGSICPNGAITYVGDDTGWTPPNSKDNNDDLCGCGCGCDCGGNC